MRRRPTVEPYNESGTTDRVFTGQTQDTTSGVYDYLFRRYDPGAGRWLSPDPAGWAVVDQNAPQSMNRYAYVENNPMSYVDMLGLDPNCTWFSFISGVSTGDEEIDDLPFCFGSNTVGYDTTLQGNGGNGGGGGPAPNSGPQKTRCTVNRALAAVPGAAATGINDPVNGHLEVGISFTAATLQADGFQFFQGPFGANGYRLGNVFVSAHVNVNGVGAQLSPSSFLSAPGGIVNGEVHFDTFNPLTGLFGLVGHTIWDYLIGHLFPHKAVLDPGC